LTCFAPFSVRILALVQRTLRSPEQSALQISRSKFTQEKLPMSEQNKAILRRVFEELWTKGNLSLADHLYSENYVHHDLSTPDFGSGPGGQKKRIDFFRTAFPDLRFTIEDVIAEGDLVSCRWTSTGTHQGPLSGVRPAGRKVSVIGMTFARFAAGKIVEGWVSWDTLTFLQQLGVVPAIFKKLPDDHRPYAEWVIEGNS
jgi:steroid delta-isomerase-like uncharacterized protein